ncbi:hypothetical protein Val02_56800 [Virgisporangium aliadipatigenens]|uniref:Secreted protein n=1 Tax=Virgisporangium aliadipatigenens TaxID=741659 RepID=A0A8J3YNH6_9ACTN|nr:hypothetical protein [Virgisporangium aliadipatigenens]GIJ48794.1 hypothetical protein Val02_56800 [Virgisporangium aliadipatigenens]
MRKHWAIGAGLWLAAAGLTTAAGVAAINTVGDNIAGSPTRPLSEADVAGRLSVDGSPTASAPAADGAPSAGATSPTPSAAAAAPSTAAAVPTTRTAAFAGPGGTVFASCAGDLASLLSATPQQGWTATTIARGPAAVVSVRFARSDGGNSQWGGAPSSFRTDIRCVNGTPEGTVDREDTGGGYPNGPRR